MTRGGASGARKPIPPSGPSVGGKESASPVLGEALSIRVQRTGGPSLHPQAAHSPMGEADYQHLLYARHFFTLSLITKPSWSRHYQVYCRDEKTKA